MSVYTNDQIREVCRLLEEDSIGNREIWKLTGVSVSTISAILSGTQWKSISKNYDFSNHTKRRVEYSDDVKLEAIRLLKEGGKSFKEIGDSVGMTRNAVWYLNKINKI